MRSKLPFLHIPPSDIDAGDNQLDLFCYDIQLTLLVLVQLSVTSSHHFVVRECTRLIL